jgi:hypothetical protein
MHATVEKHPVAETNGERGEDRKHDHYYNRLGREVASQALPMIEAAEEAGQHFLSALWHKPSEGRKVADGLGLGMSCFVRTELGELFGILALIGETNIIRPSLELILDYADEHGLVLHSGNPYNLIWLEERTASSASVEFWAKKVLAACWRRTFASMLYQNCRTALGPQRELAEIIATAAANLDAWRVPGPQPQPKPHQHGVAFLKPGRMAL